MLNRRGPLSKLVGGAAGLVSEYSADQKARKEAQSSSNVTSPGEIPSHLAPPHNYDLGHSSDESEDDESWAQDLDEAQEEARDAEATKSAENADQALANFMARHPPPPYSEVQPSGSLPMPVIIPQRRPESRHRGFIRAYAPVLENANIDQDTWLEFLDGFDKSIKANPVFHVLNVAVWTADKAYLITEGISIWAKLVSFSLHVTFEGSRRMYIHGKQNKYLDQMNESFFKPRGLYALVIKYKPDSKHPVDSVDINSNITHAVAGRDSQEHKWKNLFSSASSTTKHDEEIPQAAPLTFPYLDAMDPSQKEGAIKHFGHFVQDYYDHRQVAKWEAANPNSPLPQAPTKEFVSKYSDPNSQVNQGGLITMATGGKYIPQPPLARIRQRTGRLGLMGRISGSKPEAGASEKPGALDRDDKAPSGRKRRGVTRPMRKLLKQDAIYLMVVNMPSQEEIALVEEQLLEAEGNA